MNLVVIEGAGKKDTIKKYLGTGYEVFATKGHVRDLPQRSIAVDVENNFAPKYVIMPDKKQIVSSLKEKAAKAEKVYLATDPDREGEAIAWHLTHILGLNQDDGCRIVFNEISKNAILKAVAKPRGIDKNLVDAQQARRVLDRLVGYKLSPYLSRRISHKRLSAGRVQSVSLRLVVDRENEIRNFKPEEYWIISALLSKKGDAQRFKAVLTEYNGKKIKPASEKESKEITEQIKKAKQLFASRVKEQVTRSRAHAPFTTSTMQQEALNKMGISLKRTSVAAQKLYEGVDLPGEGKTALVTYIRTDSTRIAPDAAKMAKDYIIQNYGSEYAPETQNVFKTKKNVQDAHEAIRPINLNITPASIQKVLEPDLYKLYKLIYERFLASQMSDATFNSLSVDIVTDNGYLFRATGRTPLFKGWTAAYNYEDKKENEDDEDGDNAKLPKMEEGDAFKCHELLEAQKFTKAPPRFTEASLVKAMEERGIGRPATYVPTVSTLFARLYVEKEGKQIKPTELGEVVVKVLCDNFSDVMDIDFTAEMEDRLDDIEEGGEPWQKIVGEFYGDLEKQLLAAGEDKERIRLTEIESGENCEKCGKPMFVRVGRFGKFLGCSGYPDCKNIKPITKKVGKCPDCGGDVLERKSKKGTTFYGCSRWPDCNFISWEIPLEEKCPKCGKYLTKKENVNEVRIKCANAECDYKKVQAKGEK